MAVPLLLDTDIGDDVDDVFAVLLAALRPELSLLAVTTVLGDTPQRARITRKLLDLAGRPDVPVAAGERVTLSGHTRPPDFPPRRDSSHPRVRTSGTRWVAGYWTRARSTS